MTYGSSAYGSSRYGGGLVITPFPITIVLSESLEYSITLTESAGSTP